MISIEFPALHLWQSDVFEDIKKSGTKEIHYVVKARRQCGKSILAITTLLYFAFNASGTISTMVEPTLPQCRRVFKQLISAVGGDNSPILKSANATLLEIEFVNGSQIIFKSAEQGDALRGMTVKNGILIIDEGAFIDKEIYDILYPITDASKSPVLIISTPLFRDGEFYEKYMLGLKGESFVKSYDWSTYDTSVLLTPEKKEYYRRTMAPLKFRSEILGEFIDEGSYIFGDFTKCIGVSTKPPVFAGIDWATGNNEKDDFSCLTLMDADGAVVDIKFFSVIDPVDLAQQLANIINTTPTLTSVQIETNSIGSVYLSMLKRLIKPSLIKEFNTSNESKRRIIEQLIKAFAEGKIKIVNDARLVKQLQHYAVEKTPGGKITYNGQDNVNDDAVIALALAYDLVVKPQAKFRIGFA